MKTKGVCRLHDSRSEGFHATDDPEKAAEFVSEHMLRWIATQPADVQSRFCEHGHYAGANAVLAHVFCCFCKKAFDEESVAP